MPTQISPFCAAIFSGKLKLFQCRKVNFSVLCKPVGYRPVRRRRSGNIDTFLFSCGTPVKKGFIINLFIYYKGPRNTGIFFSEL
jgi:hypothetical protein